MATSPHALSNYTASQQQGIRDAWEAHKNDPAALKQLMQDTGVSAQTIGYAVGMDPWTVNSIVNPPTIYGNAQRGATAPGQGRDWVGMLEDAGWANRAPAPGAGTPPAATPGGGMGSQPGGAAPGAGPVMPGQNPYLQQMGGVLAQQMTDNFQTRIAPQIASGAMAAGGYGGSRQGVIEANASNDLNQQIGSALTNLYGQGYNTSLQYDLGLRNNQLGFGQLGLGYANLDRNIHNDNLANQMQGVNLGLNIWDRLNANNNAAIGAGTAIQNTPMDYWNQFSQGANSIGNGFGTQTQSGGGVGGNPLLGALGGAQLGGQISNWWGGGKGGGGWSGMPNQNVFMGTGSMGD